MDTEPQDEPVVPEEVSDTEDEMDTEVAGDEEMQ